MPGRRGERRRPVTALTTGRWAATLLTLALLSPLAFGDVDAWRLGVMESLCDLFDATSAGFSLPRSPQAVLVRHLPSEADALMNETFGPLLRWEGPAGVEELGRMGTEVAAFGAEMVVDHVEQHHQAAPVRRVDQGAEARRRVRQ